MSDALHTLAPASVPGWGSTDPIFARIIGETRPQRIIEVGTWLGASAIHMAGLCDAEIICVDTWLGAFEMWTDTSDLTRYGALSRQMGYPTIYAQFVANVTQAGVAHRIRPLPQTSQIAARLLRHWNVTADLVYIDGSHDEADVAADIAAYLPLVRPGGALFGDDFTTWYGVRRAVEGCGQPFEVHDRHWVIRR